MSEQQIRWATQHDWFVAHQGEGQIIVRDQYTLDGQAYCDMFVWCGTFKALYQWAGY